MTTSLVTTIINEALRFILLSLVKFERHDSLSISNVYYFAKLFFASFVNTVVLLFLVNGSTTNTIVRKIGKCGALAFYRMYSSRNKS